MEINAHSHWSSSREGKQDREQRFENQCYITKELKTEYCKMMDRFYFRVLWTLTFLKTEREESSLN